jgi:hypothetical protein
VSAMSLVPRGCHSPRSIQATGLRNEQFWGRKNSQLNGFTHLRLLRRLEVTLVDVRYGRKNPVRT